MVRASRSTPYVSQVSRRGISNRKKDTFVVTYHFLPPADKPLMVAAYTGRTRKYAGLFARVA